MAEVTWEGESFEVTQRIGLMPLMRFAKLAKAGADVDEMDGLAATYDLLRECLASDEEMARFEAHAVKVHADQEQLLQLVALAVAELSERPTSRPSVSSDGSSSVSERSAGGSSSPVTLLEQRGRPELALVHLMAEESRASA